MNTFLLNQKWFLLLVSLLITTSCSTPKKGSLITAVKLGEGSGTETALVYNGPKTLAIGPSGKIYYNTGTSTISTVATGEKNGQVMALTYTSQSNSEDVFGAESPRWITVDKSGTIYIADSVKNQIVRITKNAKSTLLIGSGKPGSSDGKGAEASFDQPSGLTIDTHGNVFVADTLNNKIRKITPAGVVSTLAGSGETGSKDGKGADASFYSPTALTIDQLNNLYVIQQADSKIRRITPEGLVTTVKSSSAGGSPDFGGTNASFYYPYGIVSAPDGTLYVSSYFFNTIVKITKDGRSVTIAGNGLSGFRDGISTNTQLSGPMGLALNSSGALYIADCGNNAVRILQTR